jgi:hypothetical protein
MTSQQPRSDDARPFGSHDDRHSQSGTDVHFDTSRANQGGSTGATRLFGPVTDRARMHLWLVPADEESLQRTLINLVRSSR